MHGATGRGIRAALGVPLALLARVWLATLRVTVIGDEGLVCVGGRARVFSFLHGTQWPLLAWPRRRPTLVMVSWSADGVLQATALRVLGLRVVRGSSSRGGVRGLATLARRLRGGADAAFAVDGPRGPYGVAKGGARVAARAAKGVVVPVGTAMASGIVLSRAWDRFMLAWPFSRVVVCFGQPLEPGHIACDVDEELGTAIAAANARASAELGVAAVLESPAQLPPRDAAGVGGAAK